MVSNIFQIFLSVRIVCWFDSVSSQLVNFVCPILISTRLPPPPPRPDGNLEIRHGGCRSPVAVDHGQIGTGLRLPEVVLGLTAIFARVTFVGNRKRQTAQPVPVLRIVPLTALVDRYVVLGPANRRCSIARDDALETRRLSTDDGNVLQGGNE